MRSGIMSIWGVLCWICDDYEHQNQYSNDNHLGSRFLVFGGDWTLTILFKKSN